jgi:hypothetical protein
MGVCHRGWVYPFCPDCLRYNATDHLKKMISNNYENQVLFLRAQEQKKCCESINDYYYSMCAFRLVEQQQHIYDLI